MYLIGITGAIGHGKTTLAHFLNKATDSFGNYESSDIIREVANELRRQLFTFSDNNIEQDICDWLRPLSAVLELVTHTKTTTGQLNITAHHMQTTPDEFEKLFYYLKAVRTGELSGSATITSTNKAEYRTLLQWLGGYLAKHVNGRLWFDEIVRRSQASSAELVTAGGIRFPDDAAAIRDAGGIIVAIVRTSIIAKDIDDITERERTLITSDIIIHNDGPLDELNKKARQFYQDLQNDTLQPNY